MNSTNIKDDINRLLIKLRAEKPLVHCLTNYVTVNDCANILLALGASPTMSNYIEEVEDVVEKSASLVINIGTLSKDMLNSMIVAGKKANEIGVPIVLDPVGVGSSSFRRESAFEILREVKVSVIRGNIAEIMILSGMAGKVKGVDSEEIRLENSGEVALKLAKKLNTVIAMTGDIDYISDGEKVITINNGNKMMMKVTGCGCMATAIVGAYIGVTKDMLLAASAGILTIGVAGDKALNLLKSDEGSGSFRVKLIDSIDNIKIEDIKSWGRVNE